MQILISSALLITGTILGAFLAYYFGLKKEKEIHDYRERQLAFSRIMGLKPSITQLYVSRFEARIISDYHETLWKQRGCSPDSLDLEEAKRGMRKSEDLVMEIVRERKTLLETVGLIRALFPQTQELFNITDRIYYARPPAVKGPPDDATNKETLDRWKNEAVKQLQEYVKREFGQPIENLGRYLHELVART